MKFNNKNKLYRCLSIAYGKITEIRNTMYDNEILKSVAFDMPIISVGNLSVGGTGKTPHVEFLLYILSEKFKTAVLSRGYGRETKGFRLADFRATAKTIGDEPYQIFRKFPEVIVAVDEDRVEGVQKIMEQFPDTQVIVLDDAFQHRAITPGLSILLTDYFNLYTDDEIMPAGTLREAVENAKRADIIIVTKCPSDDEMMPVEWVREKLNNPEQPVYMTRYKYENIAPVFPDTQGDKRVLLLHLEQEHDVDDIQLFLFVGIANPTPMFSYLNKTFTDVQIMEFADHRDFSKKDYKQLKEKFENSKFPIKYIITTDKDAARIVDDKNFPESLKPYIFSLPIKAKPVRHNSRFMNKIRDYVEKTLEKKKYKPK
ncbi:MAG: tetraacyldisaccharide 4'-kinase [Prevotellaceae bacterium]|jgi:tetraacyldisaccharide 4'-kinase|nr:tetraacyldisaccharide 4'-kinase [Prevotellaceae bacterium]